MWQQNSVVNVCHPNLLVNVVSESAQRHPSSLRQRLGVSMMNAKRGGYRGVNRGGMTRGRLHGYGYRGARTTRKTTNDLSVTLRDTSGRMRGAIGGTAGGGRRHTIRGVGFKRFFNNQQRPYTRHYYNQIKAPSVTAEDKCDDISCADDNATVHSIVTEKSLHNYNTMNPKRYVHPPKYERDQMQCGPFSSYADNSDSAVNGSKRQVKCTRNRSLRVERWSTPATSSSEDEHSQDDSRPYSRTSRRSSESRDISRSRSHSRIRQQSPSIGSAPCSLGSRTPSPTPIKQQGRSTPRDLGRTNVNSRDNVVRSQVRSQIYKPSNNTPYRGGYHSVARQIVNRATSVLRQGPLHRQNYNRNLQSGKNWQHTTSNSLQNFRPGHRRALLPTPSVRLAGAFGNNNNNRQSQIYGDRRRSDTSVNSYYKRQSLKSQQSYDDDSASTRTPSPTIDNSSRFDGTDIMGDKVQITYYKDIRRAKIKAQEEGRHFGPGSGSQYHSRRMSPLRNGFTPYNQRHQSYDRGDRRNYRDRDSRNYHRRHKSYSRSRSRSRSHSSYSRSRSRSPRRKRQISRDYTSPKSGSRNKSSDRKSDGDQQLSDNYQATDNVRRSRWESSHQEESSPSPERTQNEKRNKYCSPSREEGVAEHEEEWDKQSVQSESSMPVLDKQHEGESSGEEQEQPQKHRHERKKKHRKRARSTSHNKQSESPVHINHEGDANWQNTEIPSRKQTVSKREYNNSTAYDDASTDTMKHKSEDMPQRYAAAAEDMGGVKDQAMRADMDDIDRVGALGLSHENMMLVREKKEEIEKAYRHDCDIFCGVAKMLISKEGELEMSIQSTLKNNLKDIGQRCIMELREFIETLKAQTLK